MIVMAVLNAIVWLCIQIWNCINTKNLGKLHEKLTFMKFLYADKTVRTHQLEIAFSEPEEQALYEECPRRMECCMSDSDDEVPELEFIPDLTPEEKEAQELRADKRFDQDTEVAIQQSLDSCTTYQQLKNNQPHST